MRNATLLMLLVLPACSERTVIPDSGRVDGARADSLRADSARPDRGLPDTTVPGCDDGLHCTIDRTSHNGKIKSGWCMINGVCYAEPSKHPSGTCLHCVPATNKTAWSARPGYCCIQGMEYVKGAKSPDKQKTCDPAKDPYNWS